MLFLFLTYPTNVETEDTNDLSIKNSRLWQKEQIRMQHDELLAKRNNVDKNKILIACGLHDGLFLLRSVYDEIIKHQNNKYLVKLHPKANSDEIISWLEKSDIKNCELIGFNSM